MLCCAPSCYQRNATNYDGVPLCPGHFASVARLAPPVQPPKPIPVVYYIRRIDRPGQIKIGTTKDMRGRMWDLGSRGRTITVLGTEPGGRALERQRHLEFADLRIELEWFSAAASLLSHIHALA